LQATTAAAEVNTTPEAVNPTAAEVVMTASKAVAAAVAAGRLSYYDHPT